MDAGRTTDCAAAIENTNRYGRIRTEIVGISGGRHRSQPGAGGGRICRRHKNKVVEFHVTKFIADNLCPSNLIGGQPKGGDPRDRKRLNISRLIGQRHITKSGGAAGVRHQELTAENRCLIGDTPAAGHLIKPHVLAALTSRPQIHFIVAAGKSASVVHPITRIHEGNSIIGNIDGEILGSGCIAGPIAALGSPNQVLLAILVSSIRVYAPLVVVMEINIGGANHVVVTLSIPTDDIPKHRGIIIRAGRVVRSRYWRIVLERAANAVNIHIVVVLGFNHDRASGGKSIENPVIGRALARGIDNNDFPLVNRVEGQRSRINNQEIGFG